MPNKLQNAKLKQSFFNYVWNQIKNRLIWCCNNTNLHGFKFLTNENASTLARLFFAFISCCSLVLCSYLIMLQLYEYKHQFIITRIISTSYPVWKFRFPSVTVCNFNVVYKNNINKLMDVVTSHGIKKETFTDFVYNLSSLITYDDSLGHIDHYKELYEVLEQNGYNVDRTMAELAQPCNNMVKKCYWRTEEVPCSNIIQTVKTNNGYCCAFNYYGTSEIADDIIDPQNVNNTYVGLVGSNFGLHLILDAEEDQYISVIKPSYGFNVIVQNGADYPNMRLTTNTLLTGEEMKISVKPSIYVSSKNVRSIDPKKRKCLFEDEGELQWSSVYTYETCISQCTANAMHQLCGCIPFYYSFDNYTRVCTYFDDPCLELNRYKYTALHIDEHLLSDDDDGHDVEEEEEEREHGHGHEYHKRIHCNCTPQCNERIFTIQANRAKVTSEINRELSNLSVLKVYYGGDNCIKTQRDVYYTWYRILSAVGGIFSLCLGGSIISIVECFYILGKCITNYSNIKEDVEKFKNNK